LLFNTFGNPSKSKKFPAGSRIPSTNGEIIGSPTNNAIFLKPGDFKWWLVLDTMVSEMMGGVTFEDYSAIYRKWFGNEPKHAKYYMAR